MQLATPPGGRATPEWCHSHFGLSHIFRKFHQRNPKSSEPDEGDDILRCKVRAKCISEREPASCWIRSISSPQRGKRVARKPSATANCSDASTVRSVVWPFT